MGSAVTVRTAADWRGTNPATGFRDAKRHLGSWLTSRAQCSKIGISSQVPVDSLPLKSTVTHFPFSRPELNAGLLEDLLNA
jgi:hypothetical protein